MKFGRQFEFYKIPEWYEFYYDYKGIKYVLTLLDIRPKKRKKLKALLLLKNYFKKQTSNPNSLTRAESERININMTDISSKDFIKKKTQDDIMKKNRILDAEDLSIYPDKEKIVKFIGIYREKLIFVENFFTKKIQEFLKELEILEKKYDIMKVIENPKDNEKIAEEINAERDVMGYAVSRKRALSNLYNQTSWLHGYHSINSLAITKIKKKAEKVFKLYGIEIGKILEDIHSEYTFFNSSVDNLFNLRMKIQQLYSDKFTQGNVKLAHKELEKRLEGGKTISKKIYFFGVYIGVIISFIFLYIIIKVIDGKNTNDSFKPFFPLFSFSYIMILVLALTGLGIYIFRYYKMNYAFLFEIDVEKKIDLSVFYKHVLFLLAIWMILFSLAKLASKFELFGGEYTLFPVIMNTFLVVLLFLPFHVIYFSLRKGIFITFRRIMFPFGKNAVRFKDFVLANLLANLTDPLKNLFLGYCLMVCTECYQNNSRGPCNRNSIPCFLIGFYPSFIRLTQCFNKVFYTPVMCPHGFSFIKAIIGCANNLSSFFYSRKSSKIRLYFRIFLGAASTIFNIFWDFFLGWGILRKNDKYFLLREKITYPLSSYYFAIIFYIIANTTWTWNFIKIKSSLTEWRNLLICTLTLLKVFVYTIIRVENEILSNPEGYRTILAIPEVPIN